LTGFLEDVIARAAEERGGWPCLCSLIR